MSEGRMVKHEELTLLVVPQKVSGTCYGCCLYDSISPDELCDVCNYGEMFIDTTAAVKTAEEIKVNWEPWEIEAACRELKEMNLNINLLEVV